MKSEEQILNEYARLIPVKCFNGHEEEWDPFVKCCKNFKNRALNLWNLRKVILQKILGFSRGELFSCASSVTKELGASLIDEAAALYNSIDKKVFDPQYLLRFESEEEIVEACFPSSIIPKIKKPMLHNIKELDRKYSTTNISEFVKSLNTDGMNMYLKRLTGMKTAEFDYGFLDDNVVFANYPNRTVKITFKNLYEYEIDTKDAPGW
jgi:hypothetical protein